MENCVHGNACIEISQFSSRFVGEEEKHPNLASFIIHNSSFELQLSINVQNAAVSYSQGVAWLETS